MEVLSVRSQATQNNNVGGGVNHRGLKSSSQKAQVVFVKETEGLTTLRERHCSHTHKQHVRTVSRQNGEFLNATVGSAQNYDFGLEARVSGDGGAICINRLIIFWTRIQLDGKVAIKDG